MADPFYSSTICTPGLWPPGPWEIVLILLVLLLLFGGRKLPELARGLARGLRVFKSELKGVKKELEDTEEDSDQTPPEDDSRQD